VAIVKPAVAPSPEISLNCPDSVSSLSAPDGAGTPACRSDEDRLTLWAPAGGFLYRTYVRYIDQGGRDSKDAMAWIKSAPHTTGMLRGICEKCTETKGKLYLMMPVAREGSRLIR